MALNALHAWVVGKKLRLGQEPTLNMQQRAGWGVGECVSMWGCQCEQGVTC